MAPRKPPIDDDEPAHERAGDDNLDELLAGELGGANVKLSLYRLTAGSGSSGAWIDEIEPQSVSDLLRFVRDEYGGGTYFLRQLKNGKFYKQYRFTIEAPRKIPGATAAAPAADPLATVLEKLFTRLDENQRRLVEAIERRPAQDPFEMFSKMAGLIKETRVDAPTIGAEQLIAVFNKGMETAQKQVELAKTIAGNGETGFMDLAKAALESPIGAALAEAILKKPAGGSSSAPGTPAAATPALPGRVDSPPNGHDATAALDANLKWIVETLISKAALNADVGLYAEWTLDNLEPSLVQMLMQQQGILDRLAMAFPGIAQHRGWFDGLLSEMVTLSRGTEGPDAGGSDNATDEAGGHS